MNLFLRLRLLRGLCGLLALGRRNRPFGIGFRFHAPRFDGAQRRGVAREFQRTSAPFRERCDPDGLDCAASVRELFRFRGEPADFSEEPVRAIVVFARAAGARQILRLVFAAARERFLKQFDERFAGFLLDAAQIPDELGQGR